MALLRSTATPSAIPTANPTATPSAIPTANPTATASAVPTVVVREEPMNEPSDVAILAQYALFTARPILGPGPFFHG